MIGMVEIDRRRELLGARFDQKAFERIKEEAMVDMISFLADVSGFVSVIATLILIAYLFFRVGAYFYHREPRRVTIEKPPEEFEEPYRIMCWSCDATGWVDRDPNMLPEGWHRRAFRGSNGLTCYAVGCSPAHAALAASKLARPCGICLASAHQPCIPVAHREWAERQP